MSNVPLFEGSFEEFRSNRFGNTRDKAIKEPVTTDKDDFYPDKCGANDKIKSLLYFPDELLCQN